ncbi:MAG: hypothetical protein AMS17_11680 [Spirochaetes bacterium DG_61]|nr:MAG: hypothetical protein AMS17_11680 [Spirochaetes bacterium DG_61]
MPTENRTIIFIGKVLQTLADAEYPSCNVMHFTNGSSFFKSITAGELDVQSIVVFSYFENTDSLRRFVEKMKKRSPTLLMFTPLIAVLPGRSGITQDTSYEVFDYVTLSLPEPVHIEPIMDFVTAKKKTEIERIGLQMINQAILRELQKKQNAQAIPFAANAAQLYFGVDRYGIFQTIGDEVLSILGFSRDEIVGHHFLELASKEELEQLKRAFTERRTGIRGAKEIAVKFRAKDGRKETFHINSQGVHIPSVEEHPEKDPMRVYIGTYGRVTPARVIQRSIDVFEGSREPILIYNRTEGKLLVNRGFEEFSGYQREEVQDKSPDFFEKPGKSFFSRYMDSLAEQEHIVYNTVFLTKSGKERYCEVSLDHVNFEGKSTVIAIYSDLSNFMKLIDEAEILIQLSWDIGNTSSLTELVETAAGRVFSILKVPFLGIALLDEFQDSVQRYLVKTADDHRWLDAESADFNSCMYPLIRESLKEKKAVYRAVDNVFSLCSVPDLADKHAKGIVVVSPLIVSGGVIGCIVALQEETANFTLHGVRLIELSTNVVAAGIYKLRLEKELRKSLETLEARVAERTKELEDFIYTVSHDLKSPLHAAQGFADMVKKQFASSVKSSEDEYILKRIRENVDQAIYMINDLLELSRIGTRELKFEQVDLNSIINEYALQFNALNSENIRLNIKIGEKIPFITADAGRMVQLVTNLLNNSIKYRRNDEVKIVIEREVKDGRVKLFIGDNGKGIDEKDLGHVFKIFFRGKGAVEGQVEGTGLGLTIVKKIVEQHGGTIDIKSKQNSGTTVIIELPLRREEV